jgi:hypothetical protein
MFQLLIVAASSHPKYFAHHLNGKSSGGIANELGDFPSLLEKMLTTFFEISLSIFASWSYFCNRAFSLSKSISLGIPLTGKLLFSYFWYSLRHWFNNSGPIPNSSVSPWHFLLRRRVQLLSA